MALYSVICWDKPNASEIRKAHRQAHLAYVEASGIVRFAGPFMDEDGVGMIGSHVMLDCKNREAAESWTDDDPYTKAGLFAQVEIHPWHHAYGGLDEK